MDRSPIFGSTACYCVALFTLAFATASAQSALTLQHTVTRRSILQKVHRRTFPSLLSLFVNRYQLFVVCYALSVVRPFTRLFRITNNGSTNNQRKGGHSAPIACRCAVSGAISLSSRLCFSPFPRGTCPLSVAKEYLALGGGPPGFQPGSTCLAVLGNSVQEGFLTRTGLSPSVRWLSSHFRFGTPLSNLCPTAAGPTAPTTPAV